MATKRILLIMRGFTATRRLMADPLTSAIPVVAVTSYAMRGDETTALEAGCSGDVTKSIDKQFFLETVAALLADAEAPPPGEPTSRPQSPTGVHP